MFIAVADNLTLEDQDNFEEFHIAIDGDVASAVSAFAGRAIASGRDNHLWIDIAFIQELANKMADAEWQAKFHAMLDYANSNGWVNEATNQVEAHLQLPC
ncbi:MAG: hypothetical protein OXF21_06010 [bacterium]|nr:hypothetical protein [bacterium]